MDDLQRSLIERACGRLVTQYCHYIDHGQASRVARLFSVDGVWCSAEQTMSGVAEIERGFMRRETNVGRFSRHVCNNLLIDVEDADHATGVVYLTLYRHDGEVGRRSAPTGPPTFIGEYRDRFVHTVDGWRFQRRDVSADFV